MIITHGRQIFGEIHEVHKGASAFFLDCAFWMLIDWGIKLLSQLWPTSGGFQNKEG